MYAPGVFFQLRLVLVKSRCSCFCGVDRTSTQERMIDVKQGESLREALSDGGRWDGEQANGRSPRV